MSSNPRFYDRVLETSTTTGTGSYTLGGAVTGYQSWSVLGNGNSCYYCATDVDADGMPVGGWEVGVGTYTASGTTLSRDSIQASSSAGSAVNWAAGTRRVFLVVPAMYFHDGAYTSTATGTVDDLDFGNAAMIRMNNATDATIRGLLAGVAGQRVTIVSIGAGNVYFAHQDTNSSATNRLINMATSGTTPLGAGFGTASYEYDSTTARWRLIGHEQGSWITRAFSAGDYSAQVGVGSWTVASANTDKYKLTGRTLLYAYSITGTTGGSPLYVSIKIPNSFTSVTDVYSPAYIQANGSGGAEMGVSNSSTAGGTNVEIARIGAVTYSAGTVYVRGQILFEVQ